MARDTPSLSSSEKSAGLPSDSAPSPQGSERRKKKHRESASVFPIPFALLRSNPPASSDSAPPVPHSPYYDHLSEDASVWKSYMIKAAAADKAAAEVVNGELGSLLLFATLFSAILTAFLIDARQEIHQSPSQETMIDLLHLIQIQTQNQNDTTAPSTPPINLNPVSSLWINGFWYSSLICSLLSALVASLAQGWMTRYAYAPGVNWNAVQSRHRRFVHMYRWKLQSNSQVLSLPIHIAFFLFGLGLVVAVWNDALAIGIAILVLVGIIAFLYFSLSLVPLRSQYSPFRTPFSLLFSSNDDLQVEVWPDSGNDKKDILQANAIAWLLTNTSSGEKDCIWESVQAIAGLPEHQEIQKVLLKKSVRRFLSVGLWKRMNKDGGDHEQKKAYLHAIIRLLFIPPLDTSHDQLPYSSRVRRAWDIIYDFQAPMNAVSDDPSWMGFLKKPDKALCLSKNFSREIYAMGQCVRARIFVLSDRKDETLFSTVIPILIKSTEDDRNPYVNGRLKDVFHSAKTLWGTEREYSDVKLTMDPVLEALKLHFLMPAPRTHVRALNYLFRDDTFYRLVAKDLTSETITAIVETLNNGDEEVQQTSLDVLTKLIALANDDNAKKKMDKNTLINTVCDTYERFADVNVGQLLRLAKLDASIPARVVTPKVLKKIAQKLTRGDSSVRQITVKDMVDSMKLDSGFPSMLCNEEIVLAVVDNLNDPDHDLEVREASVLFLKELSKPETRVNVSTVIIEKLKKAKDWDVRRLAELAKLDYIPAPVDETKVKDAIVKAPEIDDWRVRQDVLQAVLELVGHGGPDFHEAFNDKEIIDAIVKMHQDEDYDVREASTEALAALAKLGILEHSFRYIILDEILSERYFWSEDVLLELAELARMNTVNEIYRNKILEAILDDILRRFMWRRDTEDQDALVELAKMDETTAHRIIDALVENLKELDPVVREASAGALKGLAQPETGINVNAVIIKNLKNAEDWDVRQLAELAKLHDELVPIDEPKVKIAIIKDLGSQWVQDTLQAVLELLNQGPEFHAAVINEEIVIAIVDKLKDVRQDVRETGWLVLRKLVNLETAIKVDAHEIVNKPVKARDLDMRQLVELAKPYHIPVIAKKTMMEEAIIIENLQSGDSNLQQETMQAIVDLMKLDPEFLPVLSNEKIIVAVVDRLKDQNTDVRQAAVHVLKAMDTATKDAVHKVIEKLAKAEDWNMRQLVELTQLHQMPPVDEAKLKKVIVNKLTRDDDSSVQQDTLQAIVDLMQGSEFWPVLRNEEVIVAIIDSLKDEATDVQKVGLVLKKLAKQDRIQDILEKAEEWDLQQLVGLAKLRLIRTIRTIDETKVQHAIVKKLKDESWSVRQNTLLAVSDLADRDFAHKALNNKNIIIAVIDKLEDPDTDVQNASVDALVKLATLYIPDCAGDKIVPVIIKKLEQGVDWQLTGVNALKKLYATNPNRMFKTIIRNLKESELSVQVIGLDALATFDRSDVHASPELLHMLMDFMSDNDSAVVGPSMKMLLDLVNRDGLPHSFQSDLQKTVIMLLKQPDKSVAALQALLKFDGLGVTVKDITSDPELVPYLLDLLQHDHPDVQSWCTGTLALLKLGLFEARDQVGKDEGTHG